MSDSLEIQKAVKKISQMPEKIEKGLDGIHKDLFRTIQKTKKRENTSQGGVQK